MVPARPCSLPVFLVGYFLFFFLPECLASQLWHSSTACSGCALTQQFALLIAYCYAPYLPPLFLRSCFGAPSEFFFDCLLRRREVQTLTSSFLSPTCIFRTSILTCAFCAGHWHSRGNRCLKTDGCHRCFWAWRQVGTRSAASDREPCDV